MHSLEVDLVDKVNIGVRVEVDVVLMLGLLGLSIALPNGICIDFSQPWRTCYAGCSGDQKFYLRDYNSPVF